MTRLEAYLAALSAKTTPEAPILMHLLNTESGVAESFCARFCPSRRVKERNCHDPEIDGCDVCWGVQHDPARDGRIEPYAPPEDEEAGNDQDW